MLTAFSYLGLIVTLFSCSEVIREMARDDRIRWAQRGSVLHPGKPNGMLLDPPKLYEERLTIRMRSL